MQCTQCVLSCVEVRMMCAVHPVRVILCTCSYAAYPNPCLSAGCSHECVPGGRGVFVCRCPIGMYLSSQDNRTCIDSSECTRLRGYRNLSGSMVQHHTTPIHPQFSDYHNISTILYIYYIYYIQYFLYCTIIQMRMYI